MVEHLGNAVNVASPRAALRPGVAACSRVYRLRRVQLRWVHTEKLRLCAEVPVARARHQIHVLRSHAGDEALPFLPQDIYALLRQLSWHFEPRSRATATLLLVDCANRR